MRPETYRMLAAREDSYWWHRARRAMSVALLQRCGVAHGGRWLDLGCGPGGNLALSEGFAPEITVGLDLSPIAIDLARRKQPAARLVQADLSHALPFRDASFDAVTVFNVLYHDWVRSEAAVVAVIARVLRSNGVLLITEPAFRILAREMDAAAMGHRRYRTDDVAHWCAAAGLRVERASYFTSFGFPLLLALKAVRSGRNRNDTAEAVAADMKPLNPLINSAFLALSRAEGAAIVAGWRLSFGTTLISLARKS